MIANQLQLTGQISNTPQVRYSPSGVGHAEFLFEHRSVQYEGVLQRQVYCKIRTVVSGDLFTQYNTQLIAQTTLALTGFLSVRQLRSEAQEMVFYVQYIELSKESSDDEQETSTRSNSSSVA